MIRPGNVFFSYVGLGFRSAPGPRADQLSKIKSFLSETFFSKNKIFLGTNFFSPKPTSWKKSLPGSMNKQFYEKKQQKIKDSWSTRIVSLNSFQNFIFVLTLHLMMTIVCDLASQVLLAQLEGIFDKAFQRGYGLKKWSFMLVTKNNCLMKHFQYQRQNLWASRKGCISSIS